MKQTEVEVEIGGGFFALVMLIAAFALAITLIVANGDSGMCRITSDPAIERDDSTLVNHEEIRR